MGCSGLDLCARQFLDFSICLVACIVIPLISLRFHFQVDFGIDLDSRVAIVGLNGAGKSTLLRLMVGTLEPLDGMVKRHNHLRIGQYHQVRDMPLGSCCI